MEQNEITQNWSRKKRFFVKFILLLMSLVIGLTITEICLRIVNYSFPTFYSADEFRGYVLTPRIEGWYRKEGESYVRINSDGLRDAEHSKQKPPNALRIAVIGDSYAEALQVPLENAFWKVAENRLQNCSALGGKTVEVINFGVSGYGTAQELITLQKQVWDYSPDVVLLAFTTNNDVTDNIRALKKTDEIPYFVYRDNKLELDNSFRENSAFRWRNSTLSKFGGWLRDNLRFVQLGHQAQYSIKNYLAKRRASTVTQQISDQSKPENSPTAPQISTVRAEDVGIDNLIYRAPDEAVWQEAWRVTEGLLVEMRSEVESKNAKFLVVTLSNGIQVFPEAQPRQAFLEKIGASDIFYPDTRIKNLGVRENFTVYNLAPELQVYAEQNKVFLHGFGANLGNGHWNMEGHRIAGEKLSQKLCEEFFK
ncbi:MAG TPA: SGNH/GDSL hydrolase family protein [Pyrinomonadaceae bacterium]|nr:SGNH/GDSL hydrolase family protein [Pyrinomonadaceae bacterium]